MAAGADARGTVDERHSSGLEAGQFAFEVDGAVRDVVQPLSVAFEKSTDRGIGAEGLDQLEGADEGDADTLGLEGFGWGAGADGDELEDGTALFDGMDRDGDVIESAPRG